MDGHLRELLRGASTAASLKFLAALAAFGLNLLIARMLGPEGSGIYYLAFTLVTIAAVIARFGLDNTLIRFIAAAESAGRYARVQGVYRLGFKLTVVISLVLAGVMFASAHWIATVVFNEAALSLPLQVMSLAVPPFALFVIHAQALQGMKRIRDAIATLSVIAPALMILLSPLLIIQFGVAGASAAYVMAAVVTLGFGVWRWRISTNHHPQEAGRYSIEELFSSSVPLFWVAIMNLIVAWMPTLMLGVFSTTYEVGLFNAANRTAMLVSFVLVAVNSIAAPKFAELHQQGDLAALRNVVKSSTRLMILAASPALMMFLFFPGAFLHLFGSKFEAAGNFLRIMACGQFVNVATGSVGYLLMMTGNERALRRITIVSASGAIVLCLILIPVYGALGASIATAFVVATQNILYYFSARKLVFSSEPLISK